MTTESVLADGFGTLTTPSGTYPNVLRLRTVRISGDSSSTGYVENEQDTFYRWYAAGYADYLFTWERYDANGFINGFAGYHPVA